MSDSPIRVKRNDMIDTLPDRSDDRVKRRSLGELTSRDYQAKTGVVLSAGKKGASAVITVLSTPVSVAGSSGDHSYVRTSFLGIMDHLDAANTEPVIRIPMAPPSKKKGAKDPVLQMLEAIMRFCPTEKFEPPEFYEKEVGTIIEICTFDPFHSSIKPGDKVCASNMQWSVSFSQKPRQARDKNDDELGKITRPINVPYLSYRASFHLVETGTVASLKTALARFPLSTSYGEPNPFLVDGEFSFNPDICFPNPAGNIHQDVPMFTRLTPRELEKLSDALYRPHPVQFGIIRNRLLAYDGEPPADELEEEKGLPLFYSVTIPRVVETDTFEMGYKKGNHDLKCLRGQEPSRALVFVQHPETKAGMFRKTDPTICFMAAFYETRDEKALDVPMYVDKIGILQRLPWEYYATQIFRGLEAIVCIKKSYEKSRELELKDVPANNMCTHGARGTTSLIIDFHTTFMAAGLKVKGSFAIAILEKVQTKKTKWEADGTLESRYQNNSAEKDVPDYNCQGYQTGRKVSHFLVNAYTGSTKKLPTDDSKDWDYFLIPKEGSLARYKVRQGGATEVEVMQLQAFWTRNHDPEWATKNQALAEEWFTTESVIDDIGVFCVSKSG